MNKLRQNLVTLVNSAQIRRNVELNGRSHTVVVSKTLPFNVVMNGLLYKEDTILANYMKIEGTPAPVGHPKNAAGEFISAKSQEGRNLSDIGAWNRNPRIVNSRVEVDTWIDNERAKLTPEGREILSLIDEGKPISMSIAVNANIINEKGANYDGVAEIVDIDHNAILPYDVPAAGVDKGVGLFVNTSTAIPVDFENGSTVKDKVLSALASLFKDKSLIVNEEEVKKMEKDTELHGKIDKLGEAVVTLANALKEKKEDEILANELKEIKELLLVNTNKELAEKRAKVGVLLGNEEVAKTMPLEALDAILAKSGDTHKLLPNSHQEGDTKKTADELAADTWGDK